MNKCKQTFFFPFADFYNRLLSVGYSTIVLTISIYPTTNPSTLIYPTPLFPLLDPRTAKSSGSSNSLILQLWKLEVKDYTEESVKNAGAKGIYGFVSFHFFSFTYNYHHS